MRVSNQDEVVRRPFGGDLRPSRSGQDPGACPATRSLQSYYSLHLSDDKTRNRHELPPNRDSFGSRLQLMYYHRLLSGMVSSCALGNLSATTFDFDELWEALDIDPLEQFTSATESYLRRVEAPRGLPSVTGVRRLSDLVDVWHVRMKDFYIVEVVRELTLVYHKAHGAGEVIYTVYVLQ